MNNKNYQTKIIDTISYYGYFESLLFEFNTWLGTLLIPRRLEDGVASTRLNLKLLNKVYFSILLPKRLSDLA